MLKKYGKATEQPQGPLPLLLHSEQMDGLTEPTRRWQDPCAGWCLAPSSPGQATFPVSTVFPFCRTPLLPPHPGDVGAGKAKPLRRAMAIGEGLTG